MADADRLLGMYLHLARASDLRRQPMVRDKLLVLAGVQAQEMGLEPISALCRHKILARNARHLVRQWPTLTAALGDEPFQSYLKQLRRRYSPEKIEHMVHSLGLELGREREAYFSDLEYAAALLDTRPEEIADIVAQDPRQFAEVRDVGQPPDAAIRTPGVPGTTGRGCKMLMVWGPFFVGLLALAAWAMVWRAIAR